MDRASRFLVRQRAGDRCEYCLSHQGHEPFFRFQLEHIVPRQHGGSDDERNLALACPHCNLHKGPNLSGLDPLDGELTSLFNPREHRWEDHFVFRGPLIEGVTAIGRTTVRVLDMNDRIRVKLRATTRPSE